MTKLSKDISNIIDKYTDQIGSTNTIFLYNRFAINYQTRHKNYKYRDYIDICDRFIRFVIHHYNITTDNKLLEDHINKRINDYTDCYEVLTK